MTPHIDAFAKEGLVFNQALSCTPLCSPHRASLMTGKYPQSHGVYTNCKLGADVMLRPDEICIGDVLKAAGYRTGYIGKWHLDLPEENVAERPVSGAREWDAYTPPGPKRHGFDFWHSYGAYDHHLEPHYWRDSPRMIEVKQWSVEHETDVALDFLQRSADDERPFALFVSWNPPHSPFELVPDKYKQLYASCELQLRPNVQAGELNVHTGEKVAGGKERLEQYMRDYYAAISGLDEQFGRLMAALREHGFEQDTVVVLSADHGELMGAHGLMAKHAWYEESVGIPCLMRWPGHIPRGETELLFNSVDIMPTLLGLLQLPIPEQVEGSDYSAAVRGEEGAAGAAAAFLAAFPGRKEVIEAFSSRGLDNRAYGWRAIRTANHTYVIHRGYAPEEPVQRLLYDLRADPFQLQPAHLASADEHEEAMRLEQELKQWLQRMGDAFLF